MKQAAAMLGCELADLKRLKASGSAGFSHGRVNLALVRKELDALPPPPDGDTLESKEILERRKLRAQWRKEEHRLEVEQRKSIPVAEVQRDLARIGNAQRAELSRFIGDLPNWAGLPAAEMSLRGQKWLREICENLHDETSKLYT